MCAYWEADGHLEIQNTNGYTVVGLRADLDQPKCPFVLQLFHAVAAAIMGGGGRIRGNRLFLNATTTRWFVGAMAAHGVGLPVTWQPLPGWKTWVLLGFPYDAQQPLPPAAGRIPGWNWPTVVVIFWPFSA
eukprot:scaffold27.g6025.t1